MKTTIAILFLCIFILQSCSSPKQVTNSKERLTDIWVLEKLGDLSVSRNDFSKEIPRLEIRLNENRFTGSTGCNQMEGKITATGNKIKFENIGTTKMMCEKNRDSEILQALNSADNFVLEKMKLTIKCGDKVNAVFKKVD